MIVEKGLNFRPDFSPDGRKIAFESDRLGYSDIWVCGSDGSSCEQVTSLHGIAGAPRWSPDGRFIAFEYHPKEHSEVYLVEVPGGQPRLLTTLPGADNGGPNWSRDGKWIYFYSDHGGGPLQLWKVLLSGGPPIQVTRNGGVFAAESVGRRLLYYSKFDVPGIWKMPIDGGEETRVLNQPDGSDWYDWGVTPDGIYFVDSLIPNSNIQFFDFTSGPNSVIQFFDFKSGRKSPVYTSDKPHGAGLAVSPGGRSVLYVQIDFVESSIMLMKNFQ